MRGTLRNAAIRSRLDRFIPAHAGNSGSVGPTTSCLPVHPRACGELGRRCHRKICLLGVHPRACGELPRSVDPESLFCGSSPRMRGTHATRTLSMDGSRFIPAHAGNSGPSKSRTPDNAVHPRACGELNGGIKSCRFDNGSSPRMRGTRCPTGRQ